MRDGTPSSMIVDTPENAQIRRDLGDQGTDLVYISLAWVSHDVRSSHPPPHFVPS